MFKKTSFIGVGNHKIRLDGLTKSELEPFPELKDKIVDCIKNMPKGNYLIADSEQKSYVKFDDHNVFYTDTPSIFHSQSKKYGNRKFLLTNEGKKKSLAPLYVFHTITGMHQTKADLSLVEKSLEEGIKDISTKGFSSRNPQPGSEEYYRNAALYSDLFLGGFENLNFSKSNNQAERLQIAFLKTDEIESPYHDRPLRFREGMHTTVQFGKPEDIALVVNFSPVANMDFSNVKSKYDGRIEELMNELDFKNYIFRERDFQNNSFKVLKTYMNTIFLEK